MPSRKISGSHTGESAAYTLCGPPVKMIPFGAISRSSAAVSVQGFTSE